MDRSDYFAIAESGHEILNPISAQKLAELAEVCGVRDGLKVLDVGSGKGWLLRDWARRWAIRGTGLELNPVFNDDARARSEAEGTADRLRFVEGPALEFAPEPESYDIALCIGATFAIGDFEQTIGWLRRALKPDGVMAIGEVFAAQSPFPPEGRDQEPPSLAARVAALDEAGFEVTGLITTSQPEWDHYESRHWHVVHAWATANPDHPLRADVVRFCRAERAQYVGWQRDYYGWAIFVARPALAP